MSAVRCTQCGEQQAPDARFCPRCGSANVADATDPLIGKVIADRYLLTDQLGQGTSGTIYRAEHTTLKRKMAVKILHHQLSRDEAAIERFRTEATTVGQIDNDHILQVLDFGRTDDQRLFFVMELLAGESLDAVIARDQRLAPDRVVKILLQIGEALGEAHALGYVHRDLRPRNVFLSVRREEPDFVKLLDFGLAKLVRADVETRQTALGMAFGDPRYMSPEQARGDVMDLRSDIFSLGLVGFEMLTGATPFVGKNPIEVLQQMLDKPVPHVVERRPDCPAWLDAVLDRALQKNPEHRFSTIGALLDCLRSGQAPPALIAEAITEPITAPITVPIAAPITEPITEPIRVPAATPAASRTLIMPTALPASVAAAAASSEPLVTKIPEAEETNPGHRGALREPAPTPTPAAIPTMAEVVSGELRTLPRTEPAPSGPPTATIVVEDGMRGEPTGPQRAEGDDGWFSERAVPASEEIFEDEAPARVRAPLLIGIIAGVLSLGAIGTILLWPRAPSTAPVSHAPPAPVAVTPTVTPPTPTPTPAPTPTASPTTTPPPLPTPTVTPTPPPVLARPTPPPVVESPPPKPHVEHTKPVVAATRPDPIPPAPKPRSTEPVPKGFKDPFASTPAQNGQADAFVKIGRQKLTTGDFTSAQSAFTKARELDARNSEAHAGLAEVAFEQGDYSGATIHLKQALRLSPNRARFLILLGQSYYKLGRTRDAVQEYRHAIKVDPSNLEAQHSLELAEKKLAQGG